MIYVYTFFFFMVRVMFGICLNGDLLLRRNIDGTSILAKFVYYEYQIILVIIALLLVSLENPVEPAFMSNKGPLVRVSRKQNQCTRKQNASNGSSISLFGARM